MNRSLKATGVAGFVRPLSALLLAMDSASTEHTLVGAAMILLSSLCLLTNFVVLTTIAAHAEFRVLSSFRIVLLMGVFDVLQLTGHFVTGIFTVAQYNAGFWSYKVIGVMVSPSYECYVFTTILLAFNRFVLMCCPWAESIVFSSKGFKIWVLFTFLIFVCFGGVHLSPFAYSRYLIDLYKWDYDPMYPWNTVRQHIIIYYQIFGVLIAWLFYIAITINLLKLKHQVASVTRFKANRKILLHAFVITVYSSVMNLLWHKIDIVLEPGKMQNFVINMMWIGNGGLSPLLCIALNKLLRKRIYVMFCVRLLNHSRVNTSTNAPPEVNHSARTSMRSSQEKP
ncbi:hypothetical protein QR680_008908 [Steinernema hermaphroditum]|uniref:Uncharacterized protein n=1 Tax=Steinernema hermaphroditum TaxID=289476 RepID=A0AA39IJR5_9BILA|nr:hypothetical protein QR680_008908 [Steinernema hermaphroditum]